MPMTDAGMSAKIKSKIEGLAGAPSNAQELQDFCDALGAAVVEYIQEAATVTVTGVQSGGSSASGTVE